MMNNFSKSLNLKNLTLSVFMFFFLVGSVFAADENKKDTFCGFYLADKIINKLTLVSQDKKLKPEEKISRMITVVSSEIDYDLIGRIVFSSIEGLNDAQRSELRDILKKVIETNLIKKAVSSVGPSVVWRVVRVDIINAETADVVVSVATPGGKTYELVYRVKCSSVTAPNALKCVDRCKINNLTFEDIPVVQSYVEVVSSYIEENGSAFAGLKNYMNSLIKVK